MEETSQEKWKPLATSLHCFGDHMKFRSLGPGASQLAVEQGKTNMFKVNLLLGVDIDVPTHSTRAPGASFHGPSKMWLQNAWELDGICSDGSV